MKRIAALAIVLLAPVADAQNWEEMTITVTKVAGSIHILEGRGGNIGVSVGEDGIFMIDDKYAPLVPKVKDALASISDHPVRFILNTHWHGDHTGGNEAFGESAPIIAHENVRKRLAEGSSTPGREVDPAPDGALPVITFQSGLTIHINGEEVRAFHLPKGHTDGDTVVYFTKSNVVHMGDDYFAGYFPFIDLDSGGSVRGFIDAIETVIAKVPADVKVIPGHGPLSTIDEMKSYVAMLKSTLTIVEKAIADGKTAEQVLEEDLLADYASYSWSFIPTERWVKTLYRDLGSGER